ncbi:hypothetical protein [Niallia sp. FSL W8-1348]|uniref:hypothetical protein n=1 Tax=Niallia sp. FSL W8-1348 TaxID=2954656 RepID=UPI0030F5B400
MEKIKDLVKRKSTWIVVVIFVIAMVSVYSIGSNNAKVVLNDKKMTIVELEDSIQAKQKEFNAVESQVKEINNELSEKQTEIKEGLSAINTLEINRNEASDLIDEIEGKKDEIANLDSQIQQLQGGIKEAKGKAVELPAGKFIVGKDIPENRYKVLPIGRGSNFAVFDENASVIDNTIISSSKGHGVPEYIVYLIDGYIIDAQSPFKYVPVE